MREPDDAVEDGVDNDVDRSDCEDFADESELVDVLQRSTGEFAGLSRAGVDPSNSSEAGVPGRLPKRGAKIRLLLSPILITWRAWAESPGSSKASSRTMSELGNASLTGGLPCCGESGSAAAEATARDPPSLDTTSVAAGKTSKPAPGILCISSMRDCGAAGSGDGGVAAAANASEGSVARCTELKIEFCTSSRSDMRVRPGHVSPDIDACG